MTHFLNHLELSLRQMTIEQICESESISYDAVKKVGISKETLIQGCLKKQKLNSQYYKRIYKTVNSSEPQHKAHNLDL